MNCDRFGNLAISELFKFMQECAIDHAHILGVGMESIEELNQAFVLSRAFVDVKSMPEHGSEIKIVTYAVGVERMFFIRDFEMYCNDILFASARTLWLLLNLKTRRPDRNLARTVKFPFYYNEQIGLKTPKKPSKIENKLLSFSHEVMHSDIDILGHVNNSAYIKWASDSLGKSFFGKNSCYTLNIAFLSEMKEGEQLLVYRDGLNIMGKSGDERETFRINVEI